jgi:hypothetical protein
MSDYGLGGNREYSDLRRCSWQSAKQMWHDETSLLRKFERSGDYSSLEDDQESDEISEALWGLDLGVASVVVSLAAARCIPFTSCNGGAFGDSHFESYPLVAFYAQPLWIPHLVSAAEATDVGLENGYSGSIAVFASDVRNMPRFAGSLIERRSIFAKLKLRVQRKGFTLPNQLMLPLSIQ